jgi:hypothetical protein
LKSIKIISKVKEGKLILNTERIATALKQFEGKRVEISLRKDNYYRSNQQNAYYFAVIIPLTIEAIQNEWGEIWGIEKAHEMYKTMFLCEEKANYRTGEIIKIPKSTTQNTTVQQESFHDQCRQFLREWFNVEVPLPNEEIIFE